MKVLASPTLDPLLASFRTHLNYAKRMHHLLSTAEISKNPSGTPRIYEPAVNRFNRLYSVTDRSIEMDIALARENHSFAVVAAPWFSVKCYYALYYLESVFVHKIDGTLVGFAKQGHSGVRRKMRDNLEGGRVAFTVPELMRVSSLLDARAAPPLDPGQNARTDFWTQDVCTDSLLKKLADYKFHDARMGNGWDFRRQTDRDDRDLFVIRERITPLDFFYWYRIKANYRDLDYIDFENGISPEDVVAYMEAYYGAYRLYSALLLKE